MERMRDMVLGFAVFVTILCFLYVVSDEPVSGAAQKLSWDEKDKPGTNHFPPDSITAPIFNWNKAARNAPLQAGLKGGEKGSLKNVIKQAGPATEKTTKASIDLIGFWDVFQAIEKRQESALK